MLTNIGRWTKKIARSLLRHLRKQKPVDPSEVANWYRRSGMNIGARTLIYPDVVFGRGGADPIIIGEDCVLTGCTILGHDASTNSKLGISKSPCVPTYIGNRCFIGVQSIILMGCYIGDDCIVGAGAVVTKNVPSGNIVAGNPAKIIGRVDELVNKRRELAHANPEYFRELPK